MFAIQFAPLHVLGSFRAFHPIPGFHWPARQEPANGIGRWNSFQNPDVAVVPVLHPVKSCPSCRQRRLRTPGWCIPAPSTPAILQSLLAQSVAPEWLLLPGPDRRVFVVGAEEKPPCPARVRSSELENRSLGEGVLIRPARHFRRLSGYSLRLGNPRYILGNAIYNLSLI